MKGWIALYRKIKKWQHYQNPTLRVVFEDLLLDACHEPIWCQGIRLEVGEVATSLSQLEENTGFSRHTIINALRTLEETGEIKRKRCKNYTIVKICKYIVYQSIITNNGAMVAPLTIENGSKYAPILTSSGAEGGAMVAPITTKQQNNIERDNMRACAREKIEQLKVQVSDSWSIEQALYVNHITEQQYKQLTDEIFADWLFALDESKPAQPQLDEINKKHFLAVLRIKAQILNRTNNQCNEEVSTDRNTRRRGADTTATRTEDYEDSF